jgi:LmbE family N-acetylglucosaminyl deacetylase
MQKKFVSTGAGKAPDWGKHTDTVLVIAPHPDDDVIGAGGTLAGHAAGGAPVVAVYVTAGSELREREARAALQILGAAGAFFLQYARSDLSEESSAEKAAGDIAGIIGAVRPAIIYAPCPFERHPTHLRVTELTAKAVRQAGAGAQTLWGYAVWSSIQGLPFTKAVDISPYREVKKEAIRAHASQIRIKPYDDAVLGRNAYEGICMHTHDPEIFPAAETFLDMTGLIAEPGCTLKTYAHSILRSWITMLYAGI